MQPVGIVRSQPGLQLQIEVAQHMVGGVADGAALLGQGYDGRALVRPRGRLHDEAQGLHAVDQPGHRRRVQ